MLQHVSLGPVNVRLSRDMSVVSFDHLFPPWMLDSTSSVAHFSVHSPGIHFRDDSFPDGKWHPLDSGSAIACAPRTSSGPWGGNEVGSRHLFLLMVDIPHFGQEFLPFRVGYRVDIHARNVLFSI